MKRKILIYRGGGGGIMWPPNYRPQACYCYVVLLTFGGMIPNLTLPFYQGNTDRPVHQGLHHYNWRPFSVFTPKQVLGPRTAKSQPIWIKFCTRLLLYGIHLWADLDRDRRMGGSRPNQNDYVFCNTCNAP